MKYLVIIFAVSIMALSACGGSVDPSVKETVTSKIKLIQDSVNACDVDAFTRNIDSPDVMQFYKLYSLYAGLFKGSVPAGKPVMEFTPLKMDKYGDEIKVRILIKYNNKVLTNTNAAATTIEPGDVLKKVLELGMPDEIYFIFHELPEKQYKMKRYEYPLRFSYMGLISL